MTAGCGIEHEYGALESAVPVFAAVLRRDITQPEVDERRFAPVMQAAMRVDVLHIVGREIPLRETATGVIGHGRHSCVAHDLASPAPGMGWEPDDRSGARSGLPGGGDAVDR